MSIKRVLQLAFGAALPLLLGYFFLLFPTFVSSARSDLIDVLSSDGVVVMLSVLVAGGFVSWGLDIWCFLRALWSWLRQRLS